MYSPCERCPCKLRREVCRKFCSVYKTAVQRDAEEGIVEIGRKVHDRYIKNSR
jgi:hypothetical protein